MILILPITKGDIPQLSLLEEDLFSCDRISPRQFNYLITRANSIAVKAVRSDILVGYMVLLKRKKSRRLRIYSIGVIPDARRQGVAAEMLAYAKKMAARHCCNCLSLEVSEHSNAAVQFYRKAGFLCRGEKQNFYEDGGTALLLEKHT